MIDAFKDVSDQASQVLNSLLVNGELNLSNIGAMQIGSGNKVFRGDQQGIWLGATKFADAPFSVDMEGNIVATSLDLSGFLEIGEAASDVNAGATEISGTKIQNGTIVSGKLSVTELSAITANAGTITAGTIQGVLYRSAASGVRVEIQAGSAVIKLYDSGGDEVLRIDENGTDSLIKAYDGRHLALSADGSARVYCNDTLDMNSNTIQTVNKIKFQNLSSHPSDTNAIWVKDADLFFRDGGGSLTQLN